MPKANSKIDLVTVNFAHQLTRDAFMAGVDWILDSLRDSHMIECDEEFRKEIHEAGMLVIQRYQQTMEEGLGLRNTPGTNTRSKLAALSTSHEGNLAHAENSSGGEPGQKSPSKPGV